MDDKIECVEHADGSKFWYQNGVLHRTGGPAVEWADGDKYWWLYGNKYSFSKWCEKLNLSQEEKCELVLIYG